ncbi:Cof-type HAD-IIB family hydrolase [Fusobacterium sp. PH5-44]|uniref:Cof-type HAD-IIB family hydrolase n=1 Tax=unclassified Fusobacterium TaxID=2648384 RepID=UPI003D1B40A0
MNNIKLVVCDLDGTLLGSDSLLSEYSINTIHKLIHHDINFAIASGRSKTSVSNIVNQLAISIYTICNNGANIYDKKWTLLHSLPMKGEIIKKVVNFLSKRNINFNGFDENNIYINSKNSQSIVSLERKFFQVIALDEIECYPQMMKLLAKDEPDVISKIKNEIIKEDFSKELDITISQPFCLDVVHKNATKGFGVQLLADKLNISTKEIMAFGDADNDLHMLEIVGHPVVMENGLPNLKEKFSNIAPSNSNNGVALYLEKYFNL